MFSHTKWRADRQTLIRLYLALIEPKIEYGSEVYSSACRTYLDSLQPIQNSAIRIATGAFKSSPILSLHAESGLQPLKQYRDMKMLNYYLRIKANSDKTNMRRSQ